MGEQGRFEIQKPDESLHWISFNLKAAVKELKALNSILADLKSSLSSTNSYQANRPRNNDEVPF